MGLDQDGSAARRAKWSDFDVLKVDTVGFLTDGHHLSSEYD